jgi:hypothetical protein
MTPLHRSPPQAWLPVYGRTVNARRVFTRPSERQLARLVAQGDDSAP